jgi:hypothetical protein
MTLRRGFKSEANSLALEVRAELGLSRFSPVCPFAIAENLCIPVFTVRSLMALDGQFAEQATAFIDNNRSAFSAITVFNGGRRCIVHNHYHVHVRQRSNLSHELAHALLMHPPHPPFCSSGDRVYKRELEEEAGWLGPVLLVTNEAARWALAQGMSVTDAAKHFEVSEDLMGFRFRMSGAHKIQQRWRR